MAPELHRELLKQVGESLTSGDTTECRGSGGDEPKGLQAMGRPQAQRLHHYLLVIQKHNNNNNNNNNNNVSYWC